MITELLKAVVIARFTENEALNLLQEAGAISDLCLKLSDIAEADCLKAVLALSIYVNRPNRPKFAGGKRSLEGNRFGHIV